MAGRRRLLLSEIEPCEWIEPTQPCLKGTCGEAWCAGCPAEERVRGEGAPMVLAMTGAIEVYFDGLCEPATPGGPRNPGGVACGGWVILPHPDLRVDAGGLSGHAVFCVGVGATNNVAEYRAALEALRRLWAAGYRGRVLLQGDSQLVARQFNGQYGCHSEHLIPLLASLRKAATAFAELQVGWIPRLKNAAADARSKEAYRAYVAAKSRGVAS